MNAATLNALAERCEHEEPSRDLDAAIFRATGWEGVNLAHVPELTKSLDAAVTLVPEGWGWSTETQGLPCVSPWAEVCDTTQKDWTPHQAGAATAALALCAAALKARAATAERTQAPMQSGEANPPPQGSAP